MTAAQAAKQAAKQSKQSQAWVVWVCDQGREVFDASQMRTYAPLVMIEAAYVDGVQVSQ